jgi:hypothetical protein
MRCTFMQVAIGGAGASGAAEWRNRNTSSVRARATIHLHDLAEGEVVTGWFKLLPSDARAHRGVDLTAPPEAPWTPPWLRYGLCGLA